ncbi:carbohydrate ABC transporter permease [Paenibacillus sp. HJGM_3]|uniref:carbohydrate ABC transporter permease n=1 Tax=Paenibacillus sp. HJGM_3 TaxID=3379816 RepID=UPI00385F8493
MRPKRMGRLQLSREINGWLFVAPMLVFFLAFVVYPIGSSIKSSLYGFDYTEYYWTGFGNYVTIFQDELFRKAIRNTLTFVICLVPAVTVLSLILSVMIHNQSNKMQSFLKATFYIPGVTSLVSIAMVWEYIYNNQFGLINYVLKSIGLQPVNMLGVDWAYFAITLILITTSIGSSIVVFTAALNGIPADLYESASLDGARKLRSFFSITLPMLKPTLLYVVVTGTIGAFQIFAIILLMTGGGPAYKTTTIMMLIYREAFVNMNFGIANAMGIVLCVIICLIAVLQFRVFKSDVEY